MVSLHCAQGEPLGRAPGFGENYGVGTKVQGLG